MYNPNEAILDTPFEGYSLPPITTPTDITHPSLSIAPKQWGNKNPNSTTIINEKVKQTVNPTSPLPPLPLLLQHEDCEEILGNSPMHIVSPEAIQEAIKEEKEEAMGRSHRRPFSQFASLEALKQRIPFTNSSPSLLTAISAVTDSSTATFVPPISISHSTLEPFSSFARLEEENQSCAISYSSNETRKADKLKRPPNAYLLFNRDMRRKLLQTSPKMTVAEISKEIGDNWKVLPHDQRNRYIQEASLLKQEHLKKHPDYIYTRRSKAELAESKRAAKSSKYSSATEQTSSSVDFMSTNNIESNPMHEPIRRKAGKPSSSGQKDPRGRKKKRYKHPFAPKHPMSAYLHYLASVYPQVSIKFPGSTVGPISKSISRTWHAMSAEERSPWKQKAELDKARYAQEMKIYMAKNCLNKGEEKPSHASDKEKQKKESRNLHFQTFGKIPDAMNEKYVALDYSACCNIGPSHSKGEKQDMSQMT
ncbi:high mobility group box domain-containing protein [Blakeslea trispora]|nr:high mobility group box domain-containing protein [Blakeslea trispora]